MLIVAALSASILAWHRLIRPQDSLWSSGSPEGHPGFYSAQARAMLSGGFAVPYEFLLGECYDTAELCVGYFGIAPSLLRLPAVALGVKDDLTALSMTAGLLVTVLATLGLLRDVYGRLVREERWPIGAWFRFWIMTAAAVALGPGAFLFQVVRPDVAHEAIVWSVGFAVCAAWLVFRWLMTGLQRFAWTALPIAVLSANSRPPMGFGMAALGAVAVLSAWRRSPSSARRLAPALLIATLPLAVMFGVFMLKFGTPIPNQVRNEYVAMMPVWQHLREVNHGATFGWRFIPTHIWDFLRPDALLLDWTCPWRAQPTMSGSVWPMTADMLYREPAGSLTSVVPAALVLAVLALVGPWVVRAGSDLGHLLRWGSLITLAMASIMPITWAHIAMTNRYLGDAWPMLAIGGGFGAAWLAHVAAERRHLRWVTGLLLSAAVLWSLLMLFMLPW